MVSNTANTVSLFPYLDEQYNSFKVSGNVQMQVLNLQYDTAEHLTSRVQKLVWKLIVLRLLGNASVARKDQYVSTKKQQFVLPLFFIRILSRS